jgi:hypothetical protein
MQTLQSNLPSSLLNLMQYRNFADYWNCGTRQAARLRHEDVWNAHYTQFCASQFDDGPTLVGACSEFGNSIAVADDRLGQWYAYIAAYGYCGSVAALARAVSREEAYRAAIDETPPIAEDDVPEAYGLSILEYGPGKPCYAYYCERPGFAVVDDVQNDRRSFSTSAAAESFLQDRLNNERDLLEGYVYQNNVTGTGIVRLPDYEDLRPLNPAMLKEQGIVLIWETDD